MHNKYPDKKPSVQLQFALTTTTAATLYNTFVANPMLNKYDRRKTLKYFSYVSMGGGADA